MFWVGALHNSRFLGVNFIGFLSYFKAHIREPTLRKKKKVRQLCVKASCQSLIQKLLNFNAKPISNAMVSKTAQMEPQSALLA